MLISKVNIFSIILAQTETLFWSTQCRKHKNHWPMIITVNTVNYFCRFSRRRLLLHMLLHCFEVDLSNLYLLEKLPFFLFFVSGGLLIHFNLLKKVYNFQDFSNRKNRAIDTLKISGQIVEYSLEKIICLLNFSSV